MASLDILCSNPLNLKNKITKIKQENILWAIKNLQNISWPINICLNYFMTPTKILRLTLLLTFLDSTLEHFNIAFATNSIK